MEGRSQLYLFLIIVLSLLFPHKGFAGVIETSIMGSYNRSQPAEGYRSTKRSYTGSIDFKFTAVSAVQFEYTHATSVYTFPSTLGGLLGTAVTVTLRQEDQLYNVNWVQNLVPAKFLIQPYFKVGIGRLLHKERQDFIGIVETSSQRYVNGVGGIGLRIFLTRNMALKGEFVTYVPDARFSKWKDNQNFSGGLSWVF
jgi:hypothetical protein